MAENHISYPRIIIGKWWELRKLAKENPDISFTPKSLATLLDIAVNTAYINVYPALWQFELIHKNGSLTERGRKWLKDHRYKDVCDEIIESTYPLELVHSIKDPVNNREDVKEWFLSKTRAPLNVVLQMTATYIMLSKGDPEEEHEHKIHKHTAETADTNKIKAKEQELIKPKRKYTKRAAAKAIALVDFDSVQVTPSNIQAIEPENIAAASIADVPVEITDTDGKQETEIMPGQKIEKVPHIELVEVQKTKPTVALSGDILESRVSPAININIQLIITYETPSAQIEALFRSIGKHILS